MRYKRSETRLKYDSYNNDWEKTYYDLDTGGYLVTESKRLRLSLKSDNEKAKYAVENDMCETLAKSGYHIEHVNKSYDIHINGIKADLKKTCGSGNIEKYAKKAIREQGAEKVVFEFQNNSKEVQLKLLKLSKYYQIHGYYFFSNKKTKVYEF
ncbi:MAG: hypothetical protein FWH18_10385 [Marinilabiliaceae bacterium]|nr:hypothetical protein [Marinilabiliaceae bacterium]